jgi:hypothetical protein
MDSLYQEAAWDATQVSVVKVTVTKNRNSVPAQTLEFALAF